jgi:dTDP-4-amino-4,6-dideoxygalactose transaminase
MTKPHSQESKMNMNIQDIQMLDLRAQYRDLRDEIQQILQDILESGHFILGKHVQALEKEVAEYHNAKYAVSLASGTDALHLSLRALGIREGDEVITSPFTFIATAEAITYVGARPVFADIDQHTFNIDPARIKEKITERTKAIIPVHLFGASVDMDAIMDIAKRHDQRSGIRGNVRRCSCGQHRGRGLLQFLSQQEPRRLRRRRYHDHQ